MPIVFVHGVATRSARPDPVITELMQAYLSDVISPGRNVAVEYAYWGDIAATFAWKGAARPRTPLLGQGAQGADATTPDRAVLVAELPRTALEGLPSSAPAAPAGDLVFGRVTEASTTVRPSDLTPQELSDVLTSVVVATAPESGRAQRIIAADQVAHDPGVQAALARSDVDAQCALLEAEIEKRTSGGLTGQGAGRSRLGDRLRESLGRAAGFPGFVAGRVVAEFRSPINDLATMFVGDVLAYVLRRGAPDDPGPIPRRFLDALRRATSAAPADEPVVVVSHSMGGQIVYDCVTTFLPRIAAHHDLRIDFWCATASQVGLFAELDMFLAHSADRAPGKVPFPDHHHLGAWWNVWDHNDFISYTAAPIFEDVDDEAFNSGRTPVGAHSGYLVRPSFYRRFAGKLAAAKEKGWQR